MANAVICRALKAGYPAIPIISEENVNADYEARKDWEYFWCVDPLDGTKEFIKRNGQFTVNIGLCKGGAPIAGVVYVPAADPPVMYKGALGLGPPVREEMVDDVSRARAASHRPETRARRSPLASHRSRALAAPPPRARALSGPRLRLVQVGRVQGLQGERRGPHDRRVGVAQHARDRGVHREVREARDEEPRLEPQAPHGRRGHRAVVRHERPAL